MKIFTVYVKSNSDILESAKYIQEGFSFKAFLFNLFWLLYHKLWLPAGATFLTFIIVWQLGGLALITGTQKFLITLAIFTYLGFTGRDFLRIDLEKKGYHLEDLIVASDIDDAEHKFISSVFNDIQNDIESLSDEHKEESSQTQVIS